MNRIVTIVITYNGSRWIKKCLEHLIDSSVSSDIILVDNKSTDDTIEIIKPYLQQVELIQLESNLGFGGANNIGVKRALSAGYSHIFLLNQDAYVRQDCISKLLATSLQNPEYGIISPIQLDTSGQGMDMVFKNQIKKHYNPDSNKLLKTLKQENINDVVEVRFVGAAAWFLSSDSIKKVGLFHPIFFHYGEDNNYGARVQYFGFKIGLQVTAAMIHDRNPRNNAKFLPIKLRSFPVHQLLDIRKPFVLAWIVGFHQLIRTWNKLRKVSGGKEKNLFLQTRKWFFSNVSKALSTREELKNGYAQQ